LLIKIDIAAADIIDDLIDKNKLRDRIKIDIEQTNIWTQLEIEKTTKGVIYITEKRIVLKYTDDNYQMKIENGSAYILDSEKNIVVVENDIKYNYLNISEFMERHRNSLEILSESKIVFSIEGLEGKIYINFDKDKLVKEFEYVDNEGNRVIYKIIEIIELRDLFEIDIDLNEETEYMNLNGR